MGGIDNMLDEPTYILIPGRTSDQGCGISEGKYAQRYSHAISQLQMHPDDMAARGFAEGQPVRVSSEHGSIVMPISAAKPDELPRGVLFMAYSEYSSRLMGADTHGSGMPTSKGLDVTLDSATKSELTKRDLGERADGNG